MKALFTSVLMFIFFTCATQNNTRGAEYLTVQYHADSRYPTLSNIYDPLFAPAAPVITTDPANLEVCSGQQTTLTANSDDEIYWYTSPPPAGKPVGMGKTFVTPALEQGYYVYYAIAHNDRSYSNFTSIDIVMVYPAPSLTVVSSHNAICSGETATLSARGARNLSWSTGETGQSISVSPFATSLYTVSGVNTAGCRSTESIRQVVDDCRLNEQDAALLSTSVSHVSFSENDISIYPNPNQGEFHVMLNSQTNHSNIQVLNSLGQLVYEYAAEDELSTINISHLPNGVYFVRVSVNNIIAKQDKIVKQ